MACSQEEVWALRQFCWPVSPAKGRGREREHILLETAAHPAV